MRWNIQGSRGSRAGFVALATLAVLVATAAPSFADTAPETVITGGPANPTDRTSATFQYSGTDDMTASDALSFQCSLDGGSFGACPAGYTGLAHGEHTFAVRAVDQAGNIDQTPATWPRTVKILEPQTWRLSGFYQPVDGDGTWNIVKNGSTVPLKFEVFSSSAELSDVAVVKPQFVVLGATCPGTTAKTDDIETVTTGGTSIRYDAAAGQFIQN